PPGRPPRPPPGRAAGPGPGGAGRRQLTGTRRARRLPRRGAGADRLVGPVLGAELLVEEVVLLGPEVEAEAEAHGAALEGVGGGVPEAGGGGGAGLGGGPVADAPARALR